MKINFKELIILIMCITYGLDCAAQVKIESLFIGGKTAFKSIKYPIHASRMERYGLCLVQLTYNKGDSTNTIKFLSSPSKDLSDVVSKFITQYRRPYVFPKGFKQNSIEVIIGFYFIKECDDKIRLRSSSEGEASTTNNSKYFETHMKEYVKAGFENNLEPINSPVYYLGIHTIRGGCIHIVE